MMDSLEIIVACDLEVDWYSKQNKIKSYLYISYIVCTKKSRSYLCVIRLCMFCAYTRPRYQVSIYRTIGPLIDENIDYDNSLEPPHGFEAVLIRTDSLV